MNWLWKLFRAPAEHWRDSEEEREAARIQRDADRNQDDQQSLDSNNDKERHGQDS